MSAVRRAVAAAPGRVADLAAARILRALQRRGRYRYVQPRLEPLDGGWKVVSPNCSRSIDPEGGEIDIAWLRPLPDGRWLLHARDHRQACWQPEADALPLDAALARLCDDALGRFWP